MKKTICTALYILLGKRLILVAFAILIQACGGEFDQKKAYAHITAQAEADRSPIASISEMSEKYSEDYDDSQLSISSSSGKLKFPFEPAKALDNYHTEDALYFEALGLVNLNNDAHTELLWDIGELQKAFVRIRDERFISYGDTNRRIPWLYPLDECWIRAHAVAQFLKGQDYPATKKIFISGKKSKSLGLEKVFKFDGFPARNRTINWSWHVANLALTNDGKMYVLDPALHPSGPVSVSEWVSQMNRTNESPFSDTSNFYFSVCDNDSSYGIVGGVCQKQLRTSKSDISVLETVIRQGHNFSMKVFAVGRNVSSFFFGVGALGLEELFLKIDLAYDDYESLLTAEKLPY